jgi:hypothetical protein
VHSSRCLPGQQGRRPDAPLCNHHVVETLLESDQQKCGGILACLPWHFRDCPLQDIGHENLIFVLSIMRCKDVRSLQSLWPIAEDIKNDKDSSCSRRRPSHIYWICISFLECSLKWTLAYMFSSLQWSQIFLSVRTLSWQQLGAHCSMLLNGCVPACFKEVYVSKNCIF